MSLTIGSRLGPYEILSRIGAGGMGQVWKARDTRLDRIVAIKTSAARFSERFEREARAVAALNHPHICTLFDVGPDYLVMEYVEGPEIKGPMPLDRAMKYAIQLASALEAAHKKLITHRDLKPANILIAKSGVKVLDFGLAKTAQAAEAKANDETLTRALTQEGSIVGTLQYMAPEQLQGKATDTRSDIFSFGCVLYEMLTGKRAFDGANTASVIAAVLEREPPSVEGIAPASLDWLLKRCLAKDPDERWQTARDLRAALERVEVIAAEAQTQRPSRPPMLALGIAAVLAIALAAVSFLHFRERAADPPSVTRFSIAPQKGLLAAAPTPPAVSPDGRQVVFMAVSEGNHQLWLRRFDSLNAQPLAGTENGTFPFWSPDSRTIGFFAGGKMKKMDLAGGPPIVLADASNPRGATWGAEGIIVFAPGTSSGLMQIPAAGGTARPATHLDAKAVGTQRFPRFLPDGRHFLYLATHGTGKYRLRIGSLVATEEERELPDSVDSFAEYAQGRLVFLRGSTLVARPFDVQHLAFTGEAAAVAEQIRNGQFKGDAPFGISPNGVLVYQGGVRNVGLTWLDRTGKRVGALGDPGVLFGSRLSPDGKTVAMAMSDSGNNSIIWLFDVLRGIRTRFTFNPTSDSEPIWSPDGRTIVFRSTRSGTGDLYRKSADGSKNEELLFADKLEKSPTSFSRDGRYLAYGSQGDPKTGGDIWILPNPLGSLPAAKPYPFLQTDFNERNPQFSPDGHWLAYASDESGTSEIYVAPFPGPGGKRQVSAAGGNFALWRLDGKELFYLTPDNRIMAAEVDAKGGTFSVAKVTPLFGVPADSSGPYGEGWDVSADGQRFLFALPPEGESVEPLTVVQNWIAGLKK